VLPPANRELATRCVCLQYQPGTPNQWHNSIRFRVGDYIETIQSPLKKVPAAKGRDKPRNEQRGRRRLLGDALRPGG